MLPYDGLAASTAGTSIVRRTRVIAGVVLSAALLLLPLSAVGRAQLTESSRFQPGSDEVIARLTRRIDPLEQLFQSGNTATTAFIDSLADGAMRSDLFRLESLLRLYRHHFDNLTEHLKQVKTVEDGIGAYMYAVDSVNFAKERFSKDPSDGSALAGLEQKRDAAREVLAKLLQGSTLGADLRSLKSQAGPSFRGWGTSRNSPFVRRELQQMLKKVRDSHYDFTKLEDGIHEFRRQLRWFPMTIDALDGAVMVRDDPAGMCPVPALEGLAGSAAARNKYSTPALRFPAPNACSISRCLLWEVSKTIRDLGRLKDEAQGNIAIESALDDVDVATSNKATPQETERATAIRSELAASHALDTLIAQLSACSPGPSTELVRTNALKVEMVPHPSLRFGKQLRIDFRGRFQEQGDKSPALEGDQSELDIVKRRLGFEGEAFNKAIAFQVSREMGGQKSLTTVDLPDVGNAADDTIVPGTSTTVVSSKFTVDPWREAWIGYQQFTFARAKYGLFKIPFSVDENTGATNLDFAYRSLAASSLAPGRDHGWMTHGQVYNHAVGYEYGVFDHDGHNAHTGANPDRVTGGQTKAWRITSEPLRNINSKWTDLELGYAETSSTLAEGYSSIKGKTVSGFEFYKSKFLVNGARRRSGFEMRFRPGPFSLKSEYIRVTEERLGESVYNTDLSPLTATGWYISGTWALTGEMKTNGLDEPEHPVLRGGVGAIEVGARVEKLAFGSVAGEQAPDALGSRSQRADVVLRNSDQVLTYGVNWYPNRWLKIQFNLIREELADPTEGPAPLRPAFWSKVVRFQMGF